MGAAFPERAGRVESALPDRVGRTTKQVELYRQINGWKATLNTLAITYGDRQRLN